MENILCSITKSSSIYFTQKRGFIISGWGNVTRIEKGDFLSREYSLTPVEAKKNNRASLARGTTASSISFHSSPFF
jgi:hypothetical protein